MMRTYLRQCHAEFGTFEEEYVQLGVIYMLLIDDHGVKVANSHPCKIVMQLQSDVSDFHIVYIALKIGV